MYSVRSDPGGDLSFDYSVLASNSQPFSAGLFFSAARTAHVDAHVNAAQRNGSSRDLPDPAPCSVLSSTV